jgi:hypothetical protein
MDAVDAHLEVEIHLGGLGHPSIGAAER